MNKKRFLQSFSAKCKYLLLAILMIGLFFPIYNSFASSIDVSTAEEIQSYFSSGGEIRLANDITLTDNTFVTADTTLDLNGYTLNMSDKTLVPYNALLTIEDNSAEQSGKITGTASFPVQVGTETQSGSFTINSGTIDCQGSYCVYNYGDLTINGGTISGDDYVIYNKGTSSVMNGGTVIARLTAVYNGAEGVSFIMNDGLIKNFDDEVAVRLSKPYTSFIMNGGAIEALYGIEGTTSGGNAIVAFKDAEVTINGGTITAYGNAITGNGSWSGNSEGTGAVFNVNGGTITSLQGAAIYAPQVAGITTITGGTLTGGTGIEIRAGILNISGGTIIGTGEYEVKANTNGLTTWGAAVSIAQHTTAQAIRVNITGGDFIAEVPISNTNPLGLDSATQDQVKIVIKGGDYTGDDLDDVTSNIAKGCDTTFDPATSTIAVVQNEPISYYVTAGSSGDISIFGSSGTAVTDYSDITVASNCRAGYNLSMSTTTSDNTLYLNNNNTSTHSFSPIEEDTPLLTTPNTWGYFLSNDNTYVPTALDSFNPVPSLSNPVILKNTSSTASDGDINDEMRLYFGANIGQSTAHGNYGLSGDAPGSPAGIIYYVTASPTCIEAEIDINFNQNIDGEGGSETDPSVDNFPTNKDNEIHLEGGIPVTVTLSDMIPTRDDYIFVEWNSLPDGTGTSYHPEDIITVGNNTSIGELNGDVILYAIWASGCAGGTICYDGNGATDGTMSNQTDRRGVSVSLTSPNFSRTNYGFAGWNTAADGTGTNYGPQQNALIPTSGGIILYANWIASVGTLQTWTGANSMEVGDITALTDERDGQTYAVAKLADGNVWFIENLRLDPSTADINLLNTNNPTSAFIENAPSSSSTNDFCKDNNAACINKLSYNTNNLNRSLTQSPTGDDTFSAWYSYGVLYNWYTATAGNGTYDFSNTSGDQGDGTVSGDICPAGWHLPTGNDGEFVALNNAIIGYESADFKLRASPNNFIRAGDFSGTSPSERGGYGRYWSSTASEKNKAYRLGFNGGTLTPNNTWNKWSGFSVRCVYDGNRISTSVVTINLPEHVSSISLVNATYGTQEITTTGANVTLANNTPYTISAEFEEGYTINTWSTTENGQLDNATSINTSYTVTGSATLSVTAKEATLTTYTLNYDTGTSTDIIPSESAGSYNASYTFEITTSRPFIFGQGFIGWSETAGATVADYAPGDTIILTNSDPDTISAVTITLYAVYQADSCPAGNICYFGNNEDSGTMANQSASSNASVNLIPTNYSRAGYGFAGWITADSTTTYGPNAKITTPDLSSSGLMLYANWVESEGDFQTWDGCSTMNIGDVTALTDTRDGSTYAVAKLADYKCWTIENLRLDIGSADIDATNTNNPTASFVTESESASSSSTLCNSNNSGCFDKIQYNSNNLNRSLTQDYDNNDNSSAWYSYGVYYNWYTATAGNGTYSSVSSSGTDGKGNMDGDICPKNWHLPTGNTTGEYNTLNGSINNGITNNDTNWRAYPNNFIWSGDYNNNKRTGSFGNTRLWTSTAKDNNNAYRLGLESSKVTPSSNAYNKWDAFAVRCVYNN